MSLIILKISKLSKLGGIRMDIKESTNIESRFCDMLFNQLDKCYEDWLAGIKISENYPFKSEISDNFNNLFLLMVKSIKYNLNQLELEELCLKIAKERFSAKISIGSFMQNVDLGRTIVFQNLYLVSDSVIELTPLMKKINTFFDNFSFLLVEKYNMLSLNEIQEHKRIISQNHSEKLSFLGQISSSFIHEIRNPLTSVSGFIQLIQSEYPDIKYLDIINHELKELNYRISQFLLTSKLDTYDTEERTEISLISFLQDIIDFLYPRIVDLNINIDFVIPENDVYLIVNKEEIKQVLLNILINSFEAFNYNQQDKRIHINLEGASNEVLISISNNGPAIPEDKIKLIFEPFFTSKREGTGIGLFICKQIIEKYNGTIDCCSNTKWTTFNICIGQ